MWNSLKFWRFFNGERKPPEPKAQARSQLKRRRSSDWHDQPKKRPHHSEEKPPKPKAQAWLQLKRRGSSDWDDQPNKRRHHSEDKKMQEILPDEVCMTY
jgi:hypothetical protein